MIEPNLTPQARAFFTHLWRMPAGAPAWAYWWHLPEKCSVWFDATNTLWEGLPRGEKDIYFGIHPCAQIPTENSKGEPATPAQVRSQILCIGAINCLFAEFDQKDGAELATVEALTPAPSVVVASGGGWHCYWLLAEPYALAGAAERNRAIDLQRRWVEHHGGDKDAKDLARVLRVPGTMNHKPKRNRAIVALLRCDMDRLYLLDDLAGILPAPVAPPPATPRQTVTVDSSTATSSPAETRRRAAYLEQAITAELKALAATTTGRNDQLNKTCFAVGQLVAGNPELNRSDLESRIEAIAADIGLEESERKATIRSGMIAGLKDPRPVPPPAAPAYTNGAGLTHARELATAPAQSVPVASDGGELVASPQAGTELHTDLGNARRFSRLHGKNLRYVQVWGWLHWTGQNWQRDDTGAIMELAKATADGMFTEAGALNRQAARWNEAMATAGEHERKRLAEAADKATAAAKAARDWALRTQSRPRLEAMVALAQSEPGIAARAQDFDQDPWALNVLNGVIDLRTGELHPHDPQRMITALAPVRFTPGAQCPTFLTFLERIFDKDAELATYVITFLGYSLTGNVDEQYLHVLWGSGANGKSTLIRVILDLLGNHYAGQAAPDLLLAGNDLRHPTEVADLRGRRFVAAIETGDNRRMNETLVKQLTGGDKVKARYMREDFFEFAPTWKLALVTNHKPRVAPSDALFRRLRLIPFTVTIPEDERDPRLLAKLQAEQEGILALLVRGCIAWRKAGALTAPTAVKLATGEYRSESDDLGKFLLESTDRVAGKEIQARTLYKEFGEWCEASGIRAMNQKQFGLKLADHGIEKRTDSSTHLTYYLDIVLRTNFRE